MFAQAPAPSTIPPTELMAWSRGAVCTRTYGRRAPPARRRGRGCTQHWPLLESAAELSGPLLNDQCAPWQDCMPPRARPRVESI